MITIHLSKMDHSKIIFFPLALSKVSYSFLETLLMSPTRKEKQLKNHSQCLSKAERDLQEGFYNELLFQHLQNTLSFPSLKYIPSLLYWLEIYLAEVHAHTHSCKLWHTSSGLVDLMMKGTLLPQAGEKLSAVTPHRWAIPTHACFPSLFKNKHLYTICHVSAHTQVSLSIWTFIPQPSSSTDEELPTTQHAVDPIPKWQNSH